MVNSSRVSKGARTLAESSSSAGDKCRMEGMNNGSISEGNGFDGGAEKGDAAGEPAYSSSLFPRLPAAVPLLTEKQQQLLLRYLCVSNDEASRMLMQAAARQHIYSAIGQEKTTVGIGDRTTTASTGDRGAAAAAPPAFSQEAGPSGTSGAEKENFPSGQRAAARASCSSPVSPFAAARRNTSDGSRAAAAAVKFSESRVPRLPQEEVSRWTANKETELPLQLQFKRRSQQHERVFIPRPHPQALHIEQQQRQETAMPHHQQQQQQQQTDQHEMNLRDTAAGSGLRGAADKPGTTQAVCPLRPCLRRRSNVRFRFPVAEDSEERQYEDIAARRASTRVHASPSETRNPSVVAADTVGSSTCTYEKKSSFSLSSCSHTSCCFPSCHGRGAPSSPSAALAFLHAPPNHSLDVSCGRGSSECPNDFNSQKCVLCCFRCSASSACGTGVSHVPGVQCCCCCSRLLCHDRQAAAQAPACGGADSRGAAVPTVALQASLPPVTSGSSVPCRHHCDAEVSVEDRSYCCRVACPSSMRRANPCCCCCTFCNLSFCLNEASSTSSDDEQEVKTSSFASSSLRQHIPRSLFRAVAKPEDQANTCVAGESAATRAAAARGATTSRRGQVRGERGGARRLAQLEKSTARQLFCRYLPSHEEHGPRPCCGPGTSEEMFMQQQRAPEEEQNEEVCCCCWSRRIPVSDTQQQTPAFVSTNARGQDKVRSCVTSGTTHPPSTIREPHSVVSADFPPSTAADARQGAAAAQQQGAAGKAEKGRTALQHSNSCRHCCCIQQRQRNRLPTCCIRHAEHVCQMGNEQQCCTLAHLPFPAATATAAGEEISCCAGAGSLMYGRQSASSSSALDTMKRTQQYVLEQRHLQQEQRHAQQCQMEQRQQLFTVQQPPRPSTELQQSLEEEQSYLRHIATCTEKPESFQKQQQEQVCVHGTGRAAGSLQRRYICFEPAGAAVKTPPTAAGVPMAAGMHTPSTAATLGSATPLTTPAYTPTPVLAGKEGRVPVNVRETEVSSRLRNILPRVPTGRAFLARPLTAVIPAEGTAARAVTTVQTAATRAEAATRRIASLQVAAASAPAAIGVSSEDSETTMLLEGGLWKCEAVASNTQPVVGKARVLPDSKSPASLESSSYAARVSASSAAAHSSAMTTLTSRSVSGVIAADWGSDVSVERGFCRGEGASGILSARDTGTPAAGGISALVTSAASPAVGHSAAGLAASSAVAGMGNSTGALAANGTAVRPETRADDEQLGEDLQQLLQRQQEELAEQLRRLDVLEKRQQELRQPQLRRRQDWWQRLQALEQQLQRQKVALEQQQQQRGAGMQQAMKQDSLKQLPLQSSREQHQTQGKGLSWNLVRGQQPQQQIQINGRQLPADTGVPQTHLQQRRESRALSAGGGQKRDVREASGIARPSSSGNCSQFHASEKEPVSQNDSAPAPTSLVVLSRSTRRFQPPLSTQQQQHRQRRPQQQRLQQQEGRQQQQEIEYQRRHQVKASEKWLSQLKEKAIARRGVSAHCEDSCAYSCPSDQPCFTMESEQLLLDEDDEEQELLELQEISEALEAAEF